MKERATLIKCQCWAHGIEVSSEDGGVELCFWTIGHDPKCSSLRERIRRAWHELTGKTEWTDECILSPESARELAHDLERRALEAESKRQET
jgi:hypothetical protein